MPVDANIILNAKTYAPDLAGSIQAGQQIAQNQQSLQAGQQRQQITAMQIQDMQTEQSDSQKLTSAMQGLDPKDPDYSDKLVSAAKSAGVSGKSLISLQQNQLKQKSEGLTVENQQLTLKENYLKLDAAKKAQYDQQLDSALGDMGDIEKAYKQSGGNSAAMSTLVSKHIQEEVDAGKIDQKQAAQLTAKVLPNGVFNYDVFTQAYKQTQQAANARDIAKQEADLAYKKQQTAVDGKQVTPIQVQNADGTYSTHVAVTDKATNTTVDTGAVSAPKGSGAGGANLSERASEIQAAMGEAGVGLPTNIIGTGAAAKAQFFETQSKMHPDMTPQQIAAGVRSGKLDMVAAAKEVSTAAGKAAATAGTVAGIFSKGGEADTVLAAAEKTGLSDLKAGNWTQAQLAKVKSSPDWAAYESANKELVASMATVFSRGGASSVNAQQEAEHMFPINSSIDEIKSRLAVSRKIAASVERGNTAVIDAIKKGGSLSEVIEAAGKDTAPAATGAGTSVSNW